MKRTIIATLVLAVIAIFAFVLVSCDDGYTITLHDDSSTVTKSTLLLEAGEYYGIGDKDRKYNFIFHGAYTRPDGQGELVIDPDGFVVKSFSEVVGSGNEIDVFCYYTPIKCTIPLKHGDTFTDFEFDYNSDGVALPLFDDAPENYEQIGWRTPDGQTTFTQLEFWIIEDFYDDPRYNNPPYTKPYNPPPTHLEPVYRGEEKKVLLDVGDGSIESTEVLVRYNEEFELPEPTPPSGLLFIGWMYNGEKITDSSGKGFDIYSYTDETRLVARYGQWVTVSFEHFDYHFGNIDFEYFALETEDITYKFEGDYGYQFDRLYIEYDDGTPDTNYCWYVYYYDIEGKSQTYELGDETIIVSCSDNTSTWDREFTVNTTISLDIEIICEPAVANINNTTSDAPTDGTMPTLSYGEFFTLPIAYKKGYRFDGWKLTDAASPITDASGKSLAAWHSNRRIADIEAIWIEDKNAPIPITDITSLLAVKDDPGSNYILLNDITFPDGSRDWTSFSFTGTLDGNGHKISGIEVYSDYGNVGLFTTLSGTLKNLTIENLTVVSDSVTKVNVGGICSTLTGTIENVTAEGNVSAYFASLGGFAGSISGGKITGSKSYMTLTTETLEGSALAGGFAGYMTNGTISDCESYCNITAYQNVGGIVGQCANANNVTRSTSYSSVTAGGGYVGGCVGRIEALQSFAQGTINFNNLTNNGEIISSGNNVGGVIGYASFYGSWWENASFQITFTKLTNEGKITAVSNVGGIIGHATSSTSVAAFHPKIPIKITDATNAGEIVAESTVGGIIGYGYAKDYGSLVVSSRSSGKITAKHTIGGIAGYMDNFIIDNCENEGTTLVATSYYVENSGYYVRLGGIAGKGAYITNCTNKVDIEYSEKGCYIGGIVGLLSNSISGCTNEGDITAPNAGSVGGIVGRVSHSANYNLSKLTNSGSITADESVGGILGSFYAYFTFNDSDNHTTSLTELSSSGDVYSSGGFCGGIIGSLHGEAYDHDMRFPKFKAVVSFITCSGNIVSESATATGALFGSAVTDSTGSLMDGYTFTGTLNGALAENSAIVGTASNFRVVTE
ncbi:MAG: hypothetical protein IJ309_02295 [Clostridia bacterium]|nr:hypothetical protein [Clostridia bacterium]